MRVSGSARAAGAGHGSGHQLGNLVSDMDGDDFDHYPEDDVHPSIRRAHETIGRVDALLAQPRPDPVSMWRTPEPEQPKPAPQQKQAAAMNQAAIDQALAAERRVMREHVQKRLDEVASVIGEEVGKAQREMREQFQREIAALKLELAEVRGYARGLAAAGSDDMPIPKFLRDRSDASH
jgi:hypothetical protein